MKIIFIIVFITSGIMSTAQQNESGVISELCTIDISSGEVTTVLKVPYHLEAPNWTPDGQSLIFNSMGKLYRVPVRGGDPSEIYTDFADRCNNDHVLSPDGSMIAISHHAEEDNLSRIYILPIGGGIPEKVSDKGPSYLHGWSPEGDELAYCAMRHGQYDVYTMHIPSKKEKQLTDEPGLDDGPEYSPDGSYIYFNSMRTGTMQIWRMNKDGLMPVQLTFDEYNDWFAHPSPDNRWLVFVSYAPEVDAGSHPPNKDVMLRMMPIEGGEPQVLLELFGGQGTMNVPSWSPDSKSFAFVRYEIP